MVEPPTALLLSSACALTFVGFAWLALAMETHWEQVFEQPGPPPALQRKLLRLLGGLLLLAALFLCLLTDHASMAVLVWAMLLAGAAVLIAMTLAWRPHWLRGLWPLRTRGAGEAHVSVLGHALALSMTTCGHLAPGQHLCASTRARWCELADAHALSQPGPRSPTRSLDEAFGLAVRARPAGIGTHSNSSRQPAWRRSSPNVRDLEASMRHLMVGPSAGFLCRRLGLRSPIFTGLG